MTKKQLLYLALLIIFVSVSCGLPASATYLTPTPDAGTFTPIPQAWVTPDPNATATATPFQPLGPTSTFIVTPTVEPTQRVAGGDAADIPNLPVPVRTQVPLPAGTFNMLVLGSDYRPESGYRTDVIMLVSVNARKGMVSVISFPRDLYVNIPGWMTDRINTAQARGGFNTMADTFEYNFGVRPTHYVMTNFQGFVGIINGLGGINVEVGHYLSDVCDLPQSRGGYCTVEAGTNFMDGDMALWYVRSRKTTSDLDRLQRAQEVLYAIFRQLMSRNAVARFPELYKEYQSSVETNLGLDDLLPLLPVASQVLKDSSRVRRFAIDAGEVIPYITETGAQVLLPDYNAINLIIQEAIFNQ